MNIRKTAAGVVVGLGVATLGFASASVLQLDGGTIQHGSDTVTEQVTPVKANWGLERDDNTVRSVRVDGLGGGAQGDSLFVTVHFEDGSKKAFPGVVVDSASESFAFSGPAFVTPASISSVEAWLEG